MDVMPKDEGLHPPGDDEAWQEGGYLGWFDPKAGIGGNHRIGNELVRKLANRWCGVYGRDGIQFRSNMDQVPLEYVEPGMHGFRCGSQQIFHDGEHLRFRLDEPDCRVDLIIVDVPGEASWMDSGQQKLSGRIYSEHYNVQCRVKGTAILAGVHHDVDCWAWRDHSWGVRHWDTTSCTRTLGGTFDGDVHYQCTTWLGRDGLFIKRGYIGRGGKRIPLVDAQFLILMEEDGVSARAAQLTIETEQEILAVDFEVYGGTIGQARERCGFEGVGVARTEGRAPGWGFIEINNNPRLGNSNPPFVLHDGYKNGLGRRGGLLRDRQR